MIKAADMLIARRADTRARADFATWKMMAKLNGASSLPSQAQTFLERYKTLRNEMSEAEADNAAIDLIYRNYYSDMGGAGAAPDIPAQASRPATGNVTAFKRPPAPRRKSAAAFRGQTPASGRPDICLPRRRLCRHPVFLAVRRGAEVRQHHSQIVKSARSYFRNFICRL